MMKLNLQTIGIACFTVFCYACSGSGDMPLYKDAKAPIENRVSDLVKRMTLEEKIYQLSQGVYGDNDVENNQGEVVKTSAMLGSVIYGNENAEMYNELQHKCMEESRLGIPIITGRDVIHGFRNIYPIPLACACTWNPEMVTACCQIAAREARMSGAHWTFSPMIDIARDPRWGRIAEGFGEDPYTQSVFTVAAVKGYQGDSLNSDKTVAACLKHFVGYGASEAGRDYVYTEISKQSLWDTYLPPYKAGIEAGAATVMSAFNLINGIPTSANPYTLTEILKKEWKHNGFVVSDWGAVEQIVNQGCAADEKEAVEKAFLSGVEMDMYDGLYIKHLAKLVEEKKVPMSAIDDAVSRILWLKFCLGLFENPYVDTKTEAYQNRFLHQDELATTEKAAEEVIVLLKNNSILPLKENMKRIALIGPLAKAKKELLGCWACFGHEEDIQASLFDALTAEFEGKAQINWAQGCMFDSTSSSMISEAVRTASLSDVVILSLGEDSKWSGENASRSTIALPEAQQELLKAISKTGKPIVLTLNNGRPLELGNLEPMCEAIVELWQPGTPGGRPAAGVLSGRVNPSGKLAVTFPYSSGQIPIYYNRRYPARKATQGFYQDITVEPLYAFGHGLSYSTFEYGDLQIDKTEIGNDDTFTVSVTVKNTSSINGQETVHLYISDPACSIARPMKELKAFQKEMIPAGESHTFTFSLSPKKDLSFVDENGKMLLEKGDFYIEINGQRQKIRLI